MSETIQLNPPLPGSNRQDLDHASFDKCNDLIVRRVHVCQETGEEINVKDKNLTATDMDVYNVTVTSDSLIYSQLLRDETKAFTITHRDSGTFEFSFDPSLTTFQKVKCGSSYHKDGLLLSGKTIYFRSTKDGVIEIIEWL